MAMTVQRPLIVVLSMLLAGALPAAAQSVTRAAPPDASAVQLRPGDAVRLAVKDEPSLSGEFPVTGSGDVMFPEIGTMAVAGRPFQDVERSVNSAYARLLVAPQIAMIPLLRVAVLGEVRKPGLFPVDPTQTIADVLASAGGLTPVGDAGKISLVRDGRIVALHLSPGESALRGTLHSGDQLMIGQQGLLRQNLPVFIGAGASVLAAAVTTFIVRH